MNARLTRMSWIEIRVIFLCMLTKDHCQRAAGFATEITDGAAGVIHLADDALGVASEFMASLGQADLAADSIEQTAIELAFQRGDAFAYRGLGEKQPLGGLGEGGTLGDGDKGFKTIEFHNGIE